MKNKIFTTSLLLGFAVLFSACTLLGDTPKVIEPVIEITGTPTPTVSESASVNSIEKDLNSIVILDEDFSDIK